MLSKGASRLRVIPTSFQINRLPFGAKLVALAAPFFPFFLQRILKWARVIGLQPSFVEYRVDTKAVSLILLGGA